MNRVSVIIPTRNRADLVCVAIESVLAQQTKDIELEVIVIDDGSTDNTYEVLQRLPVRYLRGKGQGVSSARNVGLEAATGDFIAFLDDDDIWNTGYPHPQLALFAQHPEYGAIISQRILGDENLRPLSEPIPEQNIPSGWIFDELLYHVVGVGSVIVRTSVVRKVGGFDPTLRGSEDWDWTLRIATHYQIGFMPAVAMIIRQHPQSRAFGQESEDTIIWHRFSDSMIVFRKHMRRLSIAKKLKLQRQYWRVRGWYVPRIMDVARIHARQKRLVNASRAVLRSIRVSPIHTALYCYRSLRQQHE